MRSCHPFGDPPGRAGRLSVEVLRQFEWIVGHSDKGSQSHQRPPDGFRIRLYEISPLCSRQGFTFPAGERLSECARSTGSYPSVSDSPAICSAAGPRRNCLGIYRRRGRHGLTSLTLEGAAVGGDRKHYVAVTAILCCKSQTPPANCEHFGGRCDRTRYHSAHCWHNRLISDI